MEIEIKISDQSFYKTCSRFHHWNGNLRDAPDWIVDLVEDGKAVVLGLAKTIHFRNLPNGFHDAYIGDLILEEAGNIEIIRQVSSRD